PEAIHALMGQNAIGVIPQYQEKENKRRDIITAAQPHSVAAEAYRVLRTNVQLRTLDHPLHTILVTSSLPAEGKSHTVANLGAVIAQADLPVILVDTDLRKPTLHHLFNLKNDKGLTTALLAPDDALSNHVQQTSIKNVRVLTSGPTPSNPAEIIGSERMKALIAKLQQETAVVIFDSPPLLSVADASLLAHQVDGTLLVVGAGMIRPDTLAHAVESLQAIDANLLGVTLTKFNPATAESYYYAAYNEAPALNGRFI
ncbi:MAG: CpsD/CapB family tyrosine-protein kinase, partial [Anaerolineales bacterium]|nr:CpsD/CapB family tyrosine-protein kinase [Anaerolineales bacterium]